MTIKQIEPLQRNCHNVIWVFTPKGESVLDVIHLDPEDGYHPSIRMNLLKLKHLYDLPHKVSALVPYVDICKGVAQLGIRVRLEKGVGWTV